MNYAAITLVAGLSITSGPMPKMEPAPPNNITAWCQGWNDAARASRQNVDHYKLLLAKSAHGSNIVAQVVRDLLSGLDLYVVVPPINEHGFGHVVFDGKTIDCTKTK